jgi:putative endonuclease
VVYIGSTDDLKKRIYFHKNGLLPGFTKKYNVTSLVYYEVLLSTEAALDREGQIKKYRREKKNQLIQKHNPDWRDLFESL